MKFTNGYLGLVWEVPLGSDLGYGYVRFTALEHHFGTYARILNHRSATKIKHFDESIFAKFDELVAPFLGYGGPPKRGDSKWKAIGYLPMKDEDYQVPDMKGSRTNGDSPYSVEWGVIRGTSTGDYLKKNESGDPLLLNFQQVKHLGFYGHLNLKFATFRVILEWMKILGMDYMDYQNQDVPDDILKDQKYIVSVSTPYSEVPKALRSRVII